MTRKKRIQSRNFSPSKYPFVFQQVLRHFGANAGAKALTFTFTDEAKAHQIRFTWYNFVRSLGTHGMQEDKAIADGIIVKKRDDTLVFSPRDDEPDFASMEAQMLEQLGEMPLTPLPVEVEDAVKKAERDMQAWLEGRKDE